MWIEKIVGDFADKKSYLAFKRRLKALPTGFREAGAALERYLLNFGPSNDGKTLIAMLGDLADLLELSAADGLGVRDVVGEDPVEFAESFLANYAGGSWIRKERERLAASIDLAVAAEHRS